MHADPGEFECFSPATGQPVEWRYQYKEDKPVRIVQVNHFSPPDGAHGSDWGSFPETAAKVRGYVDTRVRCPHSGKSHSENDLPHRFACVSGLAGLACFSGASISQISARTPLIAEVTTRNVFCLDLVCRNRVGLLERRKLSGNLLMSVEAGVKQLIFF